MNYVTLNSSKQASQVLVVDDDPIFRRLAVTRLETTLGGISEAQDGMEAWHLLKRGDFNLALIDLDMPNMNGYALMRCIRSYSATKRMALIVVTGHDDLATVQKAFQAGATGFLTKPVNWSMFLPYIKHLLDLARAADGAQAQVQEVALQAEIRGLIAEVLNTEMRSRARRVAATANQALDDPGQINNPDLLASALKVARDEANAQRRAIETLEPYVALLEKATHKMPAVHALGDLLDAAISGCASLAAERRITIARPEVPEVGIRCSEQLFSRCTTDMLAYVLSQASENSQVRLNIALDDDAATISVAGQGMRPGHHAMTLSTDDDSDGQAHRRRPPVCAPFEIGLTMSRSLARLMGGQVEVIQDEVGREGAVCLSLPDVLVQHPTPAALPEEVLIAV